MRADLLLEVVDAADPDFLGQQAAVQAVLDELGAGDKPRITVFNKIDLLPDDGGAPPSSDRAVFVSAATGVGLDLLRERIGETLRREMVAVDAVVPYERGELVARARTSGDVEEEYEERGVRVSGHLPPSIASELTAAGRRGRPAARG
jgi:GTP-binding protein HflX